MPLHRSSRAVLDAIGDDPGLHVVVKPHPGELEPNQWTDLPAGATSVASDTLGWIDWADVVVCNGTTLDLVALARGKPVVLAGRNISSRKGCCYELDTADDLNPQIHTAADRGVTDVQTKALRRLLQVAIDQPSRGVRPDSDQLSDRLRASFVAPPATPPRQRRTGPARQRDQRRAYRSLCPAGWDV